ncbi:MAG: HAMP domain-containing histidine kinase [Eubacterium sp.]|nr:HAMP domain-containing histidine kinase [Eubacterium sp.]
MKKSIQTRLILISSSLLSLSIICIFLLNVFLLPDFYQSQKMSTMTKAYNSVSKTVADVEWGNIEEDQVDKIYDKLDKLAGDYNVNVYIMQIRAYDSGEIESINYVYPNSTERLMEVTRGQIGQYIRYKFADGKLEERTEILATEEDHEIYKVFDGRLQSNFMELTGELPNNYWVYMRTNYQGIQESVSIANLFMLHVGIIILVIGVFIMFFASKQYTKPILRLAAHAQKMEKLNFEKIEASNRCDEIGILENSMYSLATKLESTISELKTANIELEHDLERRNEQEEMRREFLANVSHELKTPIALIQGYAEGLQDNINDDAESREFYCEVIVDEADKMNKMVKKLLSLNQLEFGNGQVHMEHFDLRSVVDSVIQATDILFTKNDVTLSYIKPEEAVMVWADEYMIEEVVTNYVSNAFNHVNYDKKIEVKLGVVGEKARVSVFNTGDPIPDEDIEKIWHKFYKVDKARTREYGGNGIGLSIVKAIMDAHNQPYGVKNYDNGVEFWFEVDIK